jgi:hypothetical protein
MSAFNLRSSLWKSRSAPLSWTRGPPKSNTKGRKLSAAEFYTGTDVGGEDTMETGRPLGMSTIIKSTPLLVPCTPLKARALSDLCCTWQTTFRIDIHCKTWPLTSWCTELVREDAYQLKKGLHIHPFLGEGLVLHIVCISRQKGSREEELLYMQTPPAESMRAGDVICWSLHNDSYAYEESRLRGFCDYNAVETYGNTSEGVEATTAFDFPDRPPFLASLSAFSLALRASLLVLGLALSSSFFLWLRT